MKKTGRILIVDALRGIALFLIILIHFVEHFDFISFPESNFLFSADTDMAVMIAVFVLISGKAYSVFALLFGFSFFVQMNNKEIDGIDFRPRFLWRLTVLLVLGFIHSLYYRGDILHIYALLGMVLVLLYRVDTRVLYGLSVLLALQIPMICSLVRSFVDPGYVYVQSFGMGFYEEGNRVYAAGSFFDVAAYNLWKGRALVWAWTFYNGRYLQLIALFVLGFILGRKRVFEELSRYRKPLIKILVTGFILVILLYSLNAVIASGDFTDSQKALVDSLLNSYANLAFTSVIVSLVILAYLRFRDNSFFRLFAIYGRMSLSNYLAMAIIGVLLFYGYGFGLYRYMGSTWSLISGVIVFFILAGFSKYWLARFYYGPFEWLWRALTFFNFRLRFRIPERSG